MKSSSVVFALFVLLVLFTTADAQESAGKIVKPETPKTISGGILNGKAINLPKPAYPPDAATTGAAGQVSVKVLIDETGNVMTAEATAGVENVPLRRAAEAAALQAKFSPTLLSGQPVKVSGVITYNFVLDPDARFERIKYLAVGFFLTMLRAASNNLDALNPTQAEKTEFSEIIEEFSSEMSLPMVKGLDKMTAEKRTEALNSAISSLKSRNLTTGEKWQLSMGEQLGDLFGPWLSAAAKGDQADISDLNEAESKKRLASILKLTETAPSDFPAETLAKLKRFSEMSSAETLLDPATINLLEKRIDELLSELLGQKMGGN